MASVRAHARINKPASDVWALVRDPDSIPTWLPGIESSSTAGGVRKVGLPGGMEISETIVLNDDDLRRFQYSISDGPMPLEHHLSTIDVLEDVDGSIVVYSMDVLPAEMTALFGQVVSSAVQSLSDHFA